MGAAIAVSGLRKSYGAVHAVREVSFTVAEGECVAMLGPNGAGKTTTLEILEGYQARDGGAVSVLGVDPAQGDRRWREGLGIVLQSSAVDQYLTVREVLARNAAFYPQARDVDEVIGLVRLEAKATARVNTLSGGQIRRLDVALGIVGRPRLLFLDEPTTGFDPSARREAWQLVHDLRGLGTTIMLTTHYMDEAQALADRIVVIAAGAVIAEGTPDDLGGRDSAELVIRFRLPDGVAATGLPVAVRLADNGWYDVATRDDVRVLNELTTWSLQTGHELIGLTATRPSLEDTYLALVGPQAPGGSDA